MPSSSHDQQMRLLSSLHPQYSTHHAAQSICAMVCRSRARLGRAPKTLEDTVRLGCGDGHRGLVLSGAAFYAEDDAGFVELDVDRMDRVPAFEAVMGGNDGGERSCRLLY